MKISNFQCFRFLIGERNLFRDASKDTFITDEADSTQELIPIETTPGFSK